MIINHSFYSLFELTRQTDNSKFYCYSDIKIHLFQDSKHKVKSVSVSKMSSDETLIDGMFYLNNDELIFILDRVPEIRVLYPKDISLQSIVNYFGQSCKQS